MDDVEFKGLIKEILANARRSSFKETAGVLQLEAGDEFGDVDLGGWKDLTRVIGDPKNVLKTVMGSLANISNKARTVLTIAIKGIPSLIIPAIEPHYDEIYKNEAERRRNIEQMFPEVFNVARKVFPDDATLSLFMINPVAMTAYAATRGAGDLALDLVDALSGHSPTVVRNTRALRRRTAGGAYHESLKLLEVSAARDRVARLLKQPSFMQKVTNAPSSVVRSIQDQARQAQNSALNDVLELAEEVNNAQSPEDLERLGIDISDLIDGVGRKDPAQRDPGLKAGLARQDAEEKQTEATIGQQKQDPTEESQIIKDQILKITKQQVIDLLIARLEKQMSVTHAQDSPGSRDLVRAYTNTLNRLKAMSRG